jgi:predicted N-acetyltransferase YhbS
MEAEVTIRPMTAADVPDAQALTASFKWPHRREDWALMQALGDGLVAEREGKLTGTGVAWRYGADWASLGAIGVYAELQGKRVGRRLLRGLMAPLEDRNLVLHATRTGMPLYAAEEFAPTSTIVQHQAVARRPEPAPPPSGTRLSSATPADLAPIAAQDRMACGMDRANLLAKLLGEPGGVVLEGRGVITGFALTRLFGRGRVIGPVVAPDLVRAKALVALLIERHAGEFLRIDFPKECGLAPWLATAGLLETGSVIRIARHRRAGPGRGAHLRPRQPSLRLGARPI